MKEIITNLIKLLLIMMTYGTMIAFLASALWCLHEGHGGFAIVLIIIAIFASPKISIGGNHKEEEK